MFGLFLALTAASPAPHLIRDCADGCPTMVIVPSGSFLMGSDAEERRREGVPAEAGTRETPRHAVTIVHPFAMSRDEISRGEYARFVTATHRLPPPSCATYSGRGHGKDIKQDWEDVRGASWADPGFAQTDDHPAVCINLQDAEDYAAWLSRRTGRTYRLPSEAEWEYAARGGSTTTRPWGDDLKPICDLANVMTTTTDTLIGWPEYERGKLVCVSPHGWTTPVGTYPANAFGLRDMIGNAWEWVSDCRHPNYIGAPADGSSWREPGCAGHFLRGGAFHSEFWLARPAGRFWLDTGAFGGEDGKRSAMTGMRLVRELGKE